MGYAAGCPFVVDRPVMLQRWERLSFLHWSFVPSVVQRLVPDWLTVDTYHDLAWVGLVPFFMRVWTPGGTGVPWASSFCETNVRTYVLDGEGRAGIWFLSLDAARLGAVLVARTTYCLPYFWSSMKLEARPGHVAYQSRRRWPGPRRAHSSVELDVGDSFAPSELSDFDHYLTARWVLFSSSGGRRRFARACHEPWPLRRATVRRVSDDLLPAAGLPRPETDPIAHYSDGVTVRIGRPERYRAG